MLVDRTPLHGHVVPHGRERAREARAAVDNHELRTAKAAAREVVQDSSPGLRGLAAHPLDGEQHLLSVLAHADDDEQRDRRGFLV